jgi:hypothetical protein
MEMVAQWLSGRIRIKKYKTEDVVAQTNKHGTTKNTSMKKNKKNIKHDDELEKNNNKNNNNNNNNDDDTVQSDVTFGSKNLHRKQLLNNNNNNNTDTNVDNSEDNKKLLEINQSRNEIEEKFNSTHKKNEKNMEQQKKSLVMLDISVDRKIEISNAFQSQWRSRNTPSVTNASIVLNAFQDLDMLKIVATVTVQLPIDDDVYYDDVEDDDEEEIKKRNQIKTDLVYKLTSHELLTFASTPMLDANKIAMANVVSNGSKNNNNNTMLSRINDNHPESFLWNVLSRLQVVYKVFTYCIFFFFIIALGFKILCLIIICNK